MMANVSLPTANSEAVDSDGTMYVSNAAGNFGVIALDTFENAELVLAKDAVDGGSTTKATIYLPEPAFANVVVSLRSQSPAQITVPASITIPAGSNSASFTVATTNGLTAYSRSVIATYGGVNQSATLAVQTHHVSGLTLSPPAIVGGNTSSGKVTLSEPAPVGGLVVNLASGNPSYVSVQPTLTIRQGATSATFSIYAKPYPTTYSTSIKASDSLVTKAATLTVNPK